MEISYRPSNFSPPYFPLPNSKNPSSESPGFPIPRVKRDRVWVRISHSCFPPTMVMVMLIVEHLQGFPRNLRGVIDVKNTVKSCATATCRPRHPQTSKTPRKTFEEMESRRYFHRNNLKKRMEYHDGRRAAQIKEDEEKIISTRKNSHRRAPQISLK